MDQANFSIRPMTIDDGKSVLDIFKQGIDFGLATFETEVPTWDAWDREFYNFSRFVVKNTEGKIVGWAAIKPVSKRECFAGVAEVSVYIHQDFQRLGLGKRLLQQLITDSEEHGIWLLQAGIFPQNEGSILLHQNAGFRKVGFREKMGKLNGNWEDVVLLERRSKIVGIS